MTKLMGGNGAVMEQSEVYTALQQGVIDAAENSELVYRDFKNYEVAPATLFTRTSSRNRIARLHLLPFPFCGQLQPAADFLRRKWQERIQKNRCNPWLGRHCLCFRTFYAFFTLKSG